jgi:hypothetical protein
MWDGLQPRCFGESILLECVVFEALANMPRFFLILYLLFWKRLLCYRLISSTKPNWRNYGILFKVRIGS